MIVEKGREEAGSSANRSGMKRDGELGEKCGGDSDSVFGENIRVKKIRVSDAGEEIRVFVEKGEGLNGDKVSGSEEHSANELSGSQEREKEEIVAEENIRAGDLEGNGIQVEVKENERMESQMGNFEIFGFAVEEGWVLNGSDRVRGVEQMGAIIDDSKGEEILDFDLNVLALEAEDDGNGIGFQEYKQVGPLIDERRVHIIEISSDESEDEIEKSVKVRVAQEKGKEVDRKLVYGSILGSGVDLGKMDEGGAADGSSSMNGGRRYTREEKGKAKFVDSWLSLSSDPMQLDLEPETERKQAIELPGTIQLNETSHPEETRQPLGTGNLEIPIEKPVSSYRALRALTQRANVIRYREVLSRHDHGVSAIAQINSQQQDYYPDSSKQERKMVPLEVDKDLENLQTPFSTALKTFRERNSKLSVRKLIEWKPSENRGQNISVPLIPSLLDLSLKVLANNADDIVSLEPVPDTLKQRLSNLLCDNRRMNGHILDLLVRGSPTEIHVKDCSWITEDQFMKTFESFDAKSLRVLQLDLCGQCILDYTLGKTLAQSSNSLPGLGIISLRGACRLSDNGLKALVASAPALRSINLGQCSLLTHLCIYILADSLGSILRELYIDNCQRIDAMLSVPALKKFEHLEVLSVAGIPTVCDEFVSVIITACGENMKELDLADCLNLTNYSMKVIGNTCSKLCSLNISNVHGLTDLGIHYLANGCRSIQTLKLCRNKFSDEAIAAFLEASGGSLKELSLNNISEVGHNTALSIAKCSRKLLSLDLSWCRKITDEALGLIVDSCLLLKLLKLFGCTQITNVFINGHSNSLVRILGLKSTPVLGHLNMLEPKEVLLRYSPLPSF